MARLCAGHGAHALFTVDTKGNYDLFPKADWDQYRKENDLTSIRDKLYAGCAPKASQCLLDRIVANSVSMKDSMKCIAFN